MQATALSRNLNSEDDNYDLEEKLKALAEQYEKGRAKIFSYPQRW